MLPLSSIYIDPEIQIRESTSQERIDLYREILDQLPPIRVYDTGADKYLLSDGFQRMAAAETSDPPRTEIKAEIVQGTRWDAWEYAAVANMTHGLYLSKSERRDAIRRVKRNHPDDSYRDIAKRLSVSSYMVTEVVMVDRLLSKITWKPAWRLPPTVLYEVAQAPEQFWLQLLKTLDRERWTGQQVHQAVITIKDENAPDELKQAILRGDVDPGSSAHRPPTPRSSGSGGGGGGSARLRVARDSEGEDDEEEGDEGPAVDPVGTDVGERHRPIEVYVSLKVPRPNPKPRQRGWREYDREWIWVTRGPYTFMISSKALEGGWGDPRAAQEDLEGLAYLRVELDKQLSRRLREEGWPDRQDAEEGTA
jgi:hypothetical protein